VETVRAIEYFKPSLVLFVGVAGGLKDVKLGDVVAATKVYGYESGKASRTFQIRPDVGKSTYRMEQRARAEARGSDWLQRLKGPIPDPPPRVFVEPIAAGARVVASTRSAIWKFLKANYSDAVAVEMEGHGFLQAVHANQQVDALIIRGISDLIDGKTDADTKNYQQIAARHASAFAFEILAKLDSADERRLPEEQNKHETEIREGNEILAPNITTHTLLQEFSAAIPNYCTEIREACFPFDSGQDIFQDHCDSVIEALDNLDKHVQRLVRDATALELLVKWDLDNIHSDLNAVKLELQKFRHRCPPKKTLSEWRLYSVDLHKIRTKRDSLLESLEQLSIRLNKQGYNLE
jgi:nucleoside phosphorylase